MFSGVKSGLVSAGLFNAKAKSGNTNSNARFNREADHVNSNKNKQGVGKPHPHKNEVNTNQSQARINSNAFKKFQENSEGDVSFIPSSNASANALGNAGPKHVGDLLEVPVQVKGKGKGKNGLGPRQGHTIEETRAKKGRFEAPISTPAEPPKTEEPAEPKKQKVVFNPEDHVTPPEEDRSNITSQGAIMERVGKVRVLNIHHVDFDKNNFTSGEKVSLKVSDHLKEARDHNFAVDTRTNTEKRIEEARDRTTSTETSITRAKRAAHEKAEVFKTPLPEKVEQEFEEVPEPQSSSLEERSPEAREMRKLERLADKGIIV